MKNTLLHTPHEKDCVCANCWEARYKNYKALYEQEKKKFEMACKYLHEVRDCPVENSLVDDEWDEYCEQNCPYNMEEITKCWQKYFEEKLKEK